MPERRQSVDDGFERKMLRKSEKVRRGPFTVIEHHDNGAVAMQKGACTTDNANMRPPDPFFEQTSPWRGVP